LLDAGVESPVAVIGECSGGVLAHQLACELGRDGPGPGLVALLDAPIPGVPDPPVTPRGPLRTVLHRARNAGALVLLRAQWAWYRVRHVPAPRALAHTMTFRTNVRRLRRARPSFFGGRALYVQAVAPDGTIETAGAPEYWTDHAASSDVVSVAGSHAGAESFLSRAYAEQTAGVLARELAVACGSEIA
jgi:hypothetical protein